MNALASVLVLALGPHGGLELSARAEVRTHESTIVRGIGFDVEVMPSLALRLLQPGGDIRLGYSPRFTEHALAGPGPAEILHGGFFSMAYRRRRLTLSLTADATYGRLNMLALASTVGAGSEARLGAVPARDEFEYAATRSSMAVRFELSKRWALGVLLEYALSGGVGAASRAAMPLQWGPRAEASLEQALSRRAKLVATVGASDVRFSTGPETTGIESKLAMRYSLTRRIDASMAAGVAGTGTQHAPGSGPAGPTGHPLGEVALAYRIPGARTDHFRVQTTLRMAPTIDRLTGLVDERLELGAGVWWAPSRGLSVRALASGVRSTAWRPPSALALAFGEAACSYEIATTVRIDGGARGLWERALSVTGPLSMWIGFVGVTVTPPIIAF
jgi:hypothetical protein